jgi:arsenate reductase
MLPRVSDAVLYHNPRCSKSRAALGLLEARGVALRVVEYLEQPLDRDALARLQARLTLPPAEWVRTGEDAYREAGLSADSRDAELLDAMAAHPILMERPIFDTGQRAVVGRPPERVLELL